MHWEKQFYKKRLRYHMLALRLPYQNLGRSICSSKEIPFHTIILSPPNCTQGKKYHWPYRSPGFLCTFWRLSDGYLEKQDWSVRECFANRPCIILHKCEQISSDALKHFVLSTLCVQYRMKRKVP